MPNKIPTVKLGELQSVSWEGYTQNESGAYNLTNGGFDFSYDYAKELADLRMQHSILDIQIKELRARESTLWDFDVAAQYWADSGGVRGANASVSYDTNLSLNGERRFTGGVSAGFSIDKGLGANANFGLKGVNVFDQSASATLNGGWNQLDGFNAPPSVGLKLTGARDDTTGRALWTSTSTSEVALPTTLTVGFNRQLWGLSVNIGVIVKPSNVFKNFADIGRGFRGEPIH